MSRKRCCVRRDKSRRRKCARLKRKCAHVRRKCARLRRKCARLRPPPSARVGAVVQGHPSPPRGSKRAVGARRGCRARRVDQGVADESAGTARAVFRGSLPRGIQKPSADAPAPRPKEPVATCLRFFCPELGLQSSGARPREEDKCSHGNCSRAVLSGAPREWRISWNGAFPLGTMRVFHCDKWSGTPGD